MNRSIIWALAIAAMAGCQKENDTATSNSSGTVAFSSAGIATTRTTQMLDGDNFVDAWEGNDRIGISSEGYTNNGFNKEYSNVEHATYGLYWPSKTADFESLSVESALLKPHSMSSNITYYAYYPYTSSVDENGYIEVDISKQNTESNGNLGDADFIVGTKTITTPQDEVAFTFEHMLSKVIFNVSFDDEVTIRDEDANVNNLKAQVKAYAKAKYDKEGNFISQVSGEEATTFYLDSSVDGDKAVFTAILHPKSALASQLYFYVGDKEYLVGDITNLDFKQNTIHTYNVTLGESEVLFSGESTISSWESGSPTNSSIEAASDEYLSQYWDGSVATTFNGVAYSSDIKEYEIQNGRELALLRELVINGNNMSGVTFTMTNNISLSNQPWTPIGKTSSDNSFTGTFDGGGYTISGLKMEGENHYSGIFTVIQEGAVVKNLGVDGSITGGLVSTSRHGGIAGNNFGTIKNCYNMATIYVDKGYAGGIVGENRDGGLIEDCYNKGAIYTGYGYSGGIAGMNTASTIRSVYSIGEITGRDAGGVVGKNYTTYSNIDYAFSSASNIYDANNSGNINNSTTFSSDYLFVDVEIAGVSGTYSLVDALNEEYEGTAPWQEDTKGVNDGYPILTSINY